MATTKYHKDIATTNYHHKDITTTNYHHNETATTKHNHKDTATTNYQPQGHSYQKMPSQRQLSTSYYYLYHRES